MFLSAMPATIKDEYRTKLLTLQALEPKTYRDRLEIARIDYILRQRQWPLLGKYVKPDIPTNPSDCEIYREYYCDWTAQGKPGTPHSQILQCQPIIRDDCETIVGDPNLTQEQKNAAAAYFGQPELKAKHALMWQQNRPQFAADLAATVTPEEGAEATEWHVEKYGGTPATKVDSRGSLFRYGILAAVVVVGAGLIVRKLRRKRRIGATQAG